MLRYCSAILLSIVYSLLVFQSIIPMIDYQLNKKFIASVLCVNKEKTEQLCQGSCYLKKQISKAEQATNNENKTPSTTKIVWDITFIHLPENIFCINNITINLSLTYYLRQANNTYNHYCFSILRPPIV